MTTLEKNPLDVCVERLAGKRLTFVRDEPCKLAHLTPEEYARAIKTGRGLKGWTYLLARLVQSRMGDLRYPYLKMTAYRWELLVWPDGRIVLRTIHPFPLPGRLQKITMDFDIGRANPTPRERAVADAG